MPPSRMARMITRVVLMAQKAPVSELTGALYFAREKQLNSKLLCSQD